jgi:short-subunit dehydrogenase
VENKIIWLTGASSGIGAAVLELLLIQKAKVIASSRNLESLHEFQTKYPGQLELIQLDAAEPVSVQKCIEQISSKYGYIDIVILNAGNCYYFDPKNFSMDIIHKNFTVNFFGLANCIAASLPLLRKAKNAQIIGMSSSVSYLGLPSAEGYGAAKAASRYLLEALQAHLYAENISVSIICPGFVKTPLTDKNQFPMPFIISAQRAAQYIVTGIKKRKPEIAFPLSLIILFKFIAFLPHRLRIFILAKTAIPK